MGIIRYFNELRQWAVINLATDVTGIIPTASLPPIDLTTMVTGILPVTNGGTGNAGGAWGAWVPTVTSSTGAITSYTINSASFKQISKEVWCHFDITITDAGTGSGFLLVTLPVTARTQIQTIFGRETAVLGVACNGEISNLSGFNFGELAMALYNAGSVVVTNYRIIGNGTYEAA